MKVCKIKPEKSVCSACVDTAYEFGATPNCKNCHNDENELLETHCSFWNSYVVIIRKGKLEKVEMSRVYDIRDVTEPQKLNHNSLCETETYKVGGDK